jgi:2-iminobutanoate/2-iminopropanoate deaminase
MTRDAVTSDQLPASGLPFSVAVRGGGLLFLSGQVAQDPATGELVDGDIAQQADQILRNIAATRLTQLAAAHGIRILPPPQS